MSVAIDVLNKELERREHLIDALFEDMVDAEKRNYDAVYAFAWAVQEMNQLAMETRNLELMK